MNYLVKTTKRFDKAVEKCKKRGYDTSKIKTIVDILSTGGTLPPKYRQHKLSGRYDNAWECHIEPDWLLIWQQDDHELILLMLDTGTHSDIF